MNTSMFIPVMSEVDMVNQCGQTVDDINSVYEYVDQIVLGHKDPTPEDEDDDQAQYFNVLNLQLYTVPPMLQAPFTGRAAGCLWIEKPGFSLHPEDRWQSVVHDIVVPPPRA